MKTKRIIDVEQSPGRDALDLVGYPLDRYQSHLFGLSLRIAIGTGRGRGQRHLERVDAVDVGGHRNRRHYSPAQPRCCRVRAVVGHDHSMAALVRLSDPRRIEIHEPYLPAQHQPVASLEISAGASMKAVQRVLGHSSPQITLDRYTHLFEDHLESLAESMDARYGAAGVRPKHQLGDVADLPEKARKGGVPGVS